MWSAHVLMKVEQLTFRRDELLGCVGRVRNRVILLRGEVEMRGDDCKHYVAHGGTFDV